VRKPEFTFDLLEMDFDQRGRDFADSDEISKELDN